MEIDLKEIEEEFGPQLKPSDFYFGITRVPGFYEDDWDEEEDEYEEDSYTEGDEGGDGEDIEFHIYLVEKSKWDKDDYSLEVKDSRYEYVSELLEEEVDAMSNPTPCYEVYIWQDRDDFVDGEELEDKLTNLGFTINLKVESYFNKKESDSRKDLDIDEE